MVEGLLQMVVGVIDTVANTPQGEKMVDDVAKISQHLHARLMARGFSEEQAMRIVIAMTTKFGAH